MNILLVDAMNLIRRIYEARPHKDDLIDEEVLSSTKHSLLRALKKHLPTHACAVFDSQDKTWRHELFPMYKANRSPAPQALMSVLPDFESAFDKLGVKSICIKHYEADDVIATLAKGLASKQGKVVILSTDKNFLQLLDSNTRVYDHFNDQEHDPEWVQNKYGVSHTQLVDYWALTGDSTNNIKGVSKVGPKTAQKLIADFNSLEALLASPPDGALGQRLLTQKVDAEDARELVKLKTNVRLGINLRDLRYRPA
ncbi:MAG: flap endonuclease Xni [Gammaproteobacteria bacterium]|nr:flap endonuclease Xni [Gammaproteobacteria bacterium]